MRFGAAQRSGAMHEALDEQLRRLESVSVRVLGAMAVAGLVLGVVVGIFLSPRLGFPMVPFAGAIALWFFAYGKALSRGRPPALLRFIGACVEGTVPWLSFAIIAWRQGPVYALASWVPPTLFYSLLLVALARLRPRLCFVYAACGVVLFPATYFGFAHARLPAGSGAFLFAEPPMQVIRSATMLFSGFLSAMVARGLLRAIGQAERVARAQDLFGKYRLTREIAQGGMGSVYEALYCPEGGFERRVAVKRIHPHLAATPKFVDAFREEARLSAKLAHPGIVQVLDFGRIDDSYFLVMEYVEGLTLSALVARAKAASLPLPPHVVGHLLREILTALSYAHEGARGPDGRPLRVVHRDLCPPNVLVSTNGEVKITDFGIARSLADASQSLTQHVSGHAGYMAPEQALAEPFDTRADLFPAGVIAWELFAERALFASTNASASLVALLADDVLPITVLRPELDPRWDALIERALAREPDERFASASEMLAALDAIPESRGASAAESLGRLVTELRRMPSSPPAAPQEKTIAGRRVSA